MSEKITPDGRDMTHQEREEWLRRMFRLDQENDTKWAELCAEQRIPYAGFIEEHRRQGTLQMYVDLFAKVGEKI